MESTAETKAEEELMKQKWGRRTHRCGADESADSVLRAGSKLLPAQGIDFFQQEIKV